jgi:hypothetical protein
VGKLLAWLIKFPFVLVAAVLVLALSLTGGILAIVGVVLTPVLGVGLLLLPVALALFLAAGVIARAV